MCCKFAPNLDKALRDHFVHNIRSESAQKKLLTEADWTIEQVVVIDKTKELAALAMH